VAIDDPALAQAVRYIREHACDGLTVAELVRRVPMSRRALEYSMRRFLNRSPKAEINRVQLARVKELLAETDLTLSAIAEKTGFKHPQYLSEMFKKRAGQTPKEFRISIRG
jgi:LacI family transcriptional regulator